MQRLLPPLIAISVLLTSCGPRSNHPVQHLVVPKHRATTAEKRDGAKWWLKQNRILNERAMEMNVDLAFVGDSITEGWDKPGADVLRNSFGAYKTCVLGIGGDHTQHILWRVKNGHFTYLKPKVVVLLAGTNNMEDSAQEKVDGLIRIVQEINKRSPQSQILVLGIFPRNFYPDHPQRLLNKEANTLLEKSPLIDNERIHYQHINEVFLDPDGTIPRHVMRDSLHLTPEGYQRWADAIHDTVDRLMDPAKQPSPTGP